jgi:hypothetical protein
MRAGFFCDMPGPPCGYAAHLNCKLKMLATGCTAQLFPQLFQHRNVDTVNGPEGLNGSGHPIPNSEEELNHREKDCIGSIARSYSFACGVVCAGRDPRGPSRRRC